MLRIKKYTTLFLALVLLLGVCFVSCKKEDPTQDDTVTESDTTGDESESDTVTEKDTTGDESESDTVTESDTMGDESESLTDEDESESLTDEQPDVDVEVKDILISDKGTVNFSVIFSENADEQTKDAVGRLVSAIQKRSGAKYVSLDISSPAAYSADTLEILVGDVGYAESDTVFDSIGYGDWAVRFCGNKLVVAGYSKYTLEDAITELIQAIKNGSDKEGTIALSSDMSIGDTDVEVLNYMPHIDGENYPIAVDEGQDTGLAIMSDLTVEDFNAYIKKIQDSGFELYTSNKICENLFYTYHNDTHLIHAAYYPDEDGARVTIEKKTALIPLEKDNVYVKNNNVVSSVAQIGLGEDESGGMAYCIQLADGSFIVIDGGYARDVSTIYDYMKAKSPDGEIVVAAWIITHNDPDHVEGFKAFIRTHAKDFTLKRFIANLPGFDTYAEMDGESGSSHTLGVLAETPDCQIIKAHTGYKLYICDAVIEILYTVDNFIPETADNGNVLSMVFTVEIGGERIIFFGDATDRALEIMLPKYGKYLKSDIMQLSHHGKRNYSGMKMSNTEKVYELVRPEVIMWPTSNEHYLTDGDQTTVVSKHPWNLVALESARECYIAGDGITVLELPYSFYSAYKFNPNEVRDPVCASKPSTSDSLNFLTLIADEAITKVEW